MLLMRVVLKPGTRMKATLMTVMLLIVTGKRWRQQQGNESESLQRQVWRPKDKRAEELKPTSVPANDKRGEEKQPT
eukprot:11201006-Lingulodinium_polyedra.AAC.1